MRCGWNSSEVERVAADGVGGFTVSCTVPEARPVPLLQHRLMTR
ncbi:hypothetical protein [Deinococcus hopiensis]|nr:hypothetical protein [Deinococcus hopiensis]